MDSNFSLHDTYYVVIHPVGLILSVVVLGALCRGLISFILPMRFARRFGIDAENHAGLAAIRAAGIRDALMAVSAILFMLMGYSAALGVLALAGAVTGFADAVIILRQPGSVNRLGLWVPALVLSMLGFVQLYSLPYYYLTSPPPYFPDCSAPRFETDC